MVRLFAKVRCTGSRICILSLMLGACLSTKLLSATCPKITYEEDLVFSADVEVLEIYDCDSDLKEWFNEHFNLQKKHWDEGWGWTECDASYAYPKMLNAEFLLWYGITGREQTQLQWHASTLSKESWGGSSAAGNLSLAVAGAIDEVFFRNNNGDLIYATFYFRGVSDVVNITASDPNIGSDYRIDCDPVANVGDGTRHVYGRTWRGDVIHFCRRKSPHWTAENLTSLPSAGVAYRVTGNLGIDVLAVDSQHVYGRNDDGHLMHYFWTAATGWVAENLTRMQHIGPSFQITTDPVVENVRPTHNVQHVYACNSNGELIHYWLSNSSGWSAENVTLGCGERSCPGIDFPSTGSPKVATRIVDKPDYERIYGDRSIFERVADAFLSVLQAIVDAILSVVQPIGIASAGAPVIMQGACGHDSDRPVLVHYSVDSDDEHVWHVTDFADARAADSSYRIEGIPRIDYLVNGGGPTTNIYCRNPSYELLLYSWTPSTGWDWKNLTSRFTRADGHNLFGFSEGPFTADLKVGDVVCSDVYGMGSDDKLVHYHWAPFQDWTADTVLYSELRSNADIGLVSEPAIIGFQLGDQHIYGRNQSGDIVGIIGYAYESKPWHNSHDYATWASGARHDFRYEPENSYEEVAQAICGWGRSDRVEMNCPSFNSYAPDERASVMIHEATHIIYGSMVGGWGHDKCGEDHCDEWYSHGLYDYPHGTLNDDYDGHKHSMYQIQIEFLADMSEFHSPLLPYAAYRYSADYANYLMNHRIKNPPGWTVGRPRPL